MVDALLKLFVEAYHAYSSINQQTYTCRVHKFQRPDISDVKKYVCPEVFKYVATHTWSEKQFDYGFDGVRIKLSVWVTDGAVRLNLEFLLRVLNFFVFTLNRIRRTKATAVVDVTIICCDIPKVFPDTDKVVLNHTHINSGYAERRGLPPNDQRRVVVYRVEELLKVLLHELIHLYDIDFHGYPNKYDKSLMDIYKIEVKKPWKNRNNPLALYETYTETLASYGNIIAHVLFTDKSVKVRTGEAIPWAMIQNAVTRRVKRELAFYKRQVARIVWFARRHGHYVEDSHVFSYYIVKFALFKHMHRFKKFMDEGISVGTRVEEYLRMVVDVLESTELHFPISNKTRELKLPKIPYKEPSRMTNINWPTVFSHSTSNL